MGANSPNPHSPSPDSKKKNYFPFIIAAAALLIVCALEWKDVIQYVDGEAQLTTKYQDELQKKLDKADEAEQYALLALVDGWYTCLHSGFGLYYLKAGEVWKYGTTGKGERGRYEVKFLSSNRVIYSVQFRGTLHECLLEEQRKLYTYPVLPENLAREEALRLIRPPYNPIRR